MIRFYLTLFILMLSTFAFAQVDKFQFQPDKIKTGIVYHYVKTNVDGTDPEKISVYVASPDKLEVFKFHEPGTRAGYVTAQMDWKHFHAGKLESFAVLSGTEAPLAAKLNFLSGQKKMEVEIPAMNRPMEVIEFGYLPNHIYNFDLTSLNFAFRHLKDPKGSFVVGLSDPTFAEEGPAVKYRGEMTIQYVAEEKRNEKDCRKYSISGPGLDNKKGWIWVNKDGEHFEDMESELPDNPAWSTFKLLLKSTEDMTPDQWKQFRANHWNQ